MLTAIAISTPFVFAAYVAYRVHREGKKYSESYKAYMNKFPKAV